MSRAICGPGKIRGTEKRRKRERGREIGRNTDDVYTQTTYRILIVPRDSLFGTSQRCRIKARILLRRDRRRGALAIHIHGEYLYLRERFSRTGGKPFPREK